MRAWCSSRGIAPLIAGLTLAALTAPAAAGSIRLRVVDIDGEPVPEVVVTARAPHSASPARSGGTHATMNQHGLAFEPHILVVEAGSLIDFPNGDDVMHHVYSFSPAKQFDMTIEAGTARDGMQFAEPGVVTLGCNIHDGMLGYIVVTDTPFHTKTDFDGIAELSDLPAGSYEVSIWTPRIAAKHLPDPIVREVGNAESVALEQQFDRKLYPPHAQSATSLHWSDY